MRPSGLKIVVLQINVFAEGVTFVTALAYDDVLRSTAVTPGVPP
jgi:hypothetical protein